MRLIQHPNRIQPVPRPHVSAQRKPRRPQQIAQPRKLFILQPLRRLIPHPLFVPLLMKHMPQVHQRMPSNRERELRLPRARPLHRSNQQSASIQHRRQRRQPALVVMLRPVVAQNRIRNMRLQHRRAPPLPLLQQRRQRLMPTAKIVPGQQLSRRRRRSRPRIQQRHRNLPRRKRRIQHRQIPNHQRHKPSPVPASTTISIRAAFVAGCTSPNPSVNSVVPLT